MSDFWTRRKAAVAEEVRAEEAALVAADHAAIEADNAERSDEELLQEAGLPDPDTLTTSEDVQEFLKSALPQRLKTRALRRLWRLNPVLANVDGLVDYGEDFTDAALVVPDLKTVYQVGKGMIAKLEELGAAEEAEAHASPDEAAADPEIALADAEPAVEEDAPSPLPTFTNPEDPAPLPATSRRMRFHFSHAT